MYYVRTLMMEFIFGNQATNRLLLVVFISVLVLLLHKLFKVSTVTRSDLCMHVTGTKSNFWSLKELSEHLPIREPTFNKSSELEATWIGHDSLWITMEGISFMTDPIFSERASPVRFMGTKRYRPPPCSVDELPEVSFASFTIPVWFHVVGYHDSEAVLECDHIP